ncbi:MAG: hypothetical protein IJY08_01140 [Clostridia bacterium]|nr:hypothetical protein [Clostridia bacterium]
MKKIICLMLALLCLACFVSCGEDEPKDENYIDLTSMSATMIQTQLSNMSAFPDLFADKTVKMQGFVAMSEDGADIYCVYNDATACCTRLMVLEWPEGQEMPNADVTMTVEGKYDGSYTGVVQDYICGRLTDITVSW